MQHIPNFTSKWLNYTKSILDTCGMTDIWLNQSNITSNSIKSIIKQSLIDQYFQNWHGKTQESNKGRNYYNIKDKIALENYLINLNRNDSLMIAKFRTSNHFLPTDTGRRNNVNYYDRCPLCTLNDTGDEMHMLLKCPVLNAERKKYLNQYYYRNPNMVKYVQLMTNDSYKSAHHLAMFIRIILKTNRSKYINM